MLKGLKRLFFEEIKEPDQGNAGSHSSPTALSEPNPQKGTISNQFIDILFQAMQNADTEGFDYLEFRKSLQSLKKMENMDEATRYRSATAMAQTMGAKGDELRKSAEHYIKVLDQEKAKFQKAAQKQHQTQVDGRREMIAAVQQKSKALQAQIQQLEREMEKLGQQEDTFKEELTEAEERIQKTRDNFAASHAILVSQIRKDIEKMEVYSK